MMSGRGVLPHIIMLQEVNITSAELQSMDLPEGWAAAAQMLLVGHMKGNMILLGIGGVLGSRDHVVEVEDISSAAFDLKAVRVRDLTIVSVYVHCARGKGRTIRSSISALMDTLEDTLTGREGPCIVAGDFNTASEEDQECLVEMMDAFGFVPSLADGHQYRPTHEKGGVLDWIFSRSMTSSVLHIDEQERDHHILSATLRRTHREPGLEEAVSINYGGLQKLTDEARAALQQDMEEAMTTATPDTVVEVMREVALKHLGRARPPCRRLPKEWMSLTGESTSQGVQTGNTETPALWNAG